MFIIHGPVDPESPLFEGRRHELDQVAGWMDTPRCIGAVLGPRQLGKTSLLLRARQELQDRYPVVRVNFQGVGTCDEATCFRFIAEQLTEALGCPECSLGSGTPSVEFGRFLRQLAPRLPAIRVAVFFDELGVLSSDTAAALGHTLRSVFDDRYDHREYRHYGFVAAGSMDLLDLTWGKNSPLSNVTETIYLEDLIAAESERLLSAGFDLSHRRIPKEAADEIFAWTDGHPYWTQLLGHELLRRSEEPTAGTVRTIAQDLLHREDRNLPHTRRMLDQASPAARELVRAVVSGARRKFNRHTQEIAQMELAGLIKDSGGYCAIRNRFYEAVAREASAADGAGETLGGKPSPPRSLALAVGIGAYHHIRVLHNTRQDAEDIAALISVAGGDAADVRILTDATATKAAILKSLVWLADKAGINDTVIVYFSGHGMQVDDPVPSEEFLCPVEADPRRIPDTMISHIEFTEALRRIAASRLIVFLDACHSGGVGEAKDHTISIKAGLSDAAYTMMAGGSGRIIIAACRPDEFAYELPGMRNGLFTHHVLEGLRGRAVRDNGEVWLSDLWGYVYRTVSKQGRQHPFQKSHGEDFPLLKIQSARLEPAHAASAAQLRQAIEDGYDENEFIALCHDLAVAKIGLRRLSLSRRVIELIEHFERRDSLAQLVEKVCADRPHLNRLLRPPR